MAAVLDDAENRAGPLHTGDEAEDATVERLRPLGRSALDQWSKQRHTAVSIGFTCVIISPPRPTQPTAKPSSLRSPLAITSASSPRCASAKNPQTSRTTTPPCAPRFAIWAIAPINSTMPAPSRSICHRLRRHRQAATATPSMPASRKPAPRGPKPSSTASANSALSAQNSTRETLGTASDLTTRYTPWDVQPGESRARIITVITPTAPPSIQQRGIRPLARNLHGTSSSYALNTSSRLSTPASHATYTAHPPRTPAPPLAAGAGACSRQCIPPPLRRH